MTDVNEAAMRRCAETAREHNKRGIARDLAAQGCTPEQVAEQLEAFDQLFDDLLARELRKLRAWQENTDTTVH
jgi:hypothetical protein